MESIAKPFLRWAGGKKWLLNVLLSLVPENYNNYFEPFLGGGAVFFAVNPQHKASLSDVNEELILTYSCVKKDPLGVYSLLQQYENTKEEYYRIRESEPEESFERAARFIYLNHTSFNALYRVNREGKFNVPYGNKKRVEFDKENLFAVSERLNRAELSSGDFESILHSVKAGDLVYLDPPYVVAKESNRFIRYNKRLFSIEDQERLSSCIDRIKEANAYYILSNAKHDMIREIFEKEGDTTLTLSRSSLIGGKKAYRGLIEEYLFTNIPDAIHSLESGEYQQK